MFQPITLVVVEHTAYLFKQLLSTVCHLNCIEPKVFREAKTLPIPARKQSHPTGQTSLPGIIHLNNHRGNDR